MARDILCHTIRCQYSGVVLGKLEAYAVAGVLPYLTEWSKTLAIHPMFSMQHGKLLQFTRDEWARLAQRATDDEISDTESELLRVSFLALLHSLGSIRQEVPGLPALGVVVANIESLFQLASWKFFLESQRFKFPEYKVSKINGNADFKYVKDYLDVCFDVRRDYAKKVRDAIEEEKVRSTEKAIVALHGTWIKPAGKKMLWQWVRAHLPEKYQADAEGWLGTLFLGGSSAIIDFDQEDIQLAEEIIISNCPAGTGVLFAVRKRLDAILAAWKEHHTAFEVDLEDYAEDAGLFINGQKVKAPHPGPEPQKQDFKNIALFYVAHAKWTIAAAAYKKDHPND